MLELQHRLTRQIINIAIGKAMEDMKGNTDNTKRSIRNLIDLRLLFSKSENNKWFFTTAQKVAVNRRNPYNSLATRIISDVDNDTIKKVGLNLGYSSLIYGANKIRKRREELGFTLPWFLVFDASESDTVLFLQMVHFVKEGQELGIYSYITCLHKKDGIISICEIAKRFEACLFVLKVPSVLVSEQTAKVLGKIHNIIVSVQAEKTDFSCESDIKAFQLLKQNRCLYGFNVNYKENTIEQIISPEYIRSAISLGNLFSVYIAENNVSDTSRDAVYAFACQERSETGQPLIAVEWYRDIQIISAKILSGDNSIAFNLAEKVYYECIRAKDVLTKPLIEILRNMRPCMNV